MSHGVTSGRTIAGRYGSPSSYCQGCDMRLLVGEPRASSAWPALLMLTPEQVDVLLMAAAEWEELGGGTAVEFVDWMSVDALRAKVLPPPDHDGAPPRWEKTGVTAGPHRASHRHPFPIPYGGPRR